ncbi:zf-HC2 domain-containing protein [Streptomyces sp. NPDC000594]|uniref:anti-sigma factor family protein n=1 Tax=Streptomyces sp. NPDC000594 TaxID=3154261 RepID=UPI003329001B
MTEPYRADAHVRLMLGAYVLDALTPEENQVVAAHVQWCADCRDEYLELAEMPLFLAAYDGPELLPPPAPEPPRARPEPDTGPGATGPG